MKVGMWQRKALRDARSVRQIQQEYFILGRNSQCVGLLGMPFYGMKRIRAVGGWHAQQELST